MNLRDYLHFNNLTIVEFADKIKIHPNYLSAIARGARLPSPLVAGMIEVMTNGEVTAKEVLEMKPIKKIKRPKKKTA